MSDSIYILNTGEERVEDARLDFQHKLFWGITTTLLPDEATQYLSQLPAPKIGDVGSGTGIWLKDLANELPGASILDGYDFDTSKFAAPETLPPNVKLQFGNILEPFPSELHAKYDLVHVRLLFYALKADQWTPAAKNLMRLLKPGGYLLWEELGYTTYLSLPPSKALNEYIDIEVRAAKALGRDPWHNLNLGRYVQGAGYVGVEERSFYSIRNPALGEGSKTAVRNIAKQSLQGLVESGGVDGMRTMEESERLQKTMRHDFDHGSEVCIGMDWVWGRKPE